MWERDGGKDLAESGVCGRSVGVMRAGDECASVVWLTGEEDKTVWLTSETETSE